MNILAQGGVFAFVFLIAFQSAYNYMSQNYVYDKGKGKAQKEKEREEEIQRIKEQAPHPISGIVQYDMQNAAAEVALMPVEDHKRVDEVEEDVLDEIYEFRREQKETAATVNDTAKVVSKEQGTSVFLQSFLHDSLAHLQKAEMKLQGDVRQGLLFFIYAAVLDYIRISKIPEEQADQLLYQVMDSLGVKEGERDQLFLDYEDHLDDPLYCELFEKAVRISRLAQYGQMQAIEGVCNAIQLWSKAISNREMEQNRPFVLGVRFDVNRFDGASAWPMEWGEFLRQFTSYIIDYDEDHDVLLMDFRTIRGVFEAVLLMRLPILQANEEMVEAKTHMRFILTHLSEDEIEGDTAIKLIDQIDETGLYFTNAVFREIKSRNSYTLSHFPDQKLYRFDGFVEDDDTDKEAERAETSANDNGSVTRAKEMVLQQFD